MSKASEAKHAEWVADLKARIPTGTRIYTVLRHVSQSGMQREIDLFYIKDNDLCTLSYSASKLLGLSYGTHGGLKVRGVGMDMGFSLVYNLSYAVHGDGYSLKHSWI